MTSTYVTKISTNGRVSVPAVVRARWGAERVAVIDMGDRLVTRPLGVAPISEMRAKYQDAGRLQPTPVPISVGQTQTQTGRRSADRP